MSDEQKAERRALIESNKANAGGQRNLPGIRS